MDEITEETTDERFEEEIYRRRWQRIRDELFEEEEKEIFLITLPGNIRYLSCAHIPSFPLINYMVIERDGGVTGITSSLEQYRATEEAAYDDLKIFSPYPGIRSDGRKAVEVLKNMIRKASWEEALVDERAPTKLIRQERTSLLEEMRIEKSDVEMNFIRRACEVTDRAATRLPEMIEPGVSERQLAARLNGILRENEDVQTTSFETIIAGGPHAAFSHHDVTDRKLKKGDAVIADFGVYANGYCSDCTRTFFVGGPGEELRDIYELVHEGQRKGIEMVKKGESYGEIDRNIRDIFKEAGYRKNFVHSTGHGIGLEVHEAPNGIKVGMKKKIGNGHVFTVEPGIYLPGKGGVRIEDDVFMDDGTTVTLTNSPKSL